MNPIILIELYDRLPPPAPRTRGYGISSDSDDANWIEKLFNAVLWITGIALVASIIWPRKQFVLEQTPQPPQTTPVIILQMKPLAQAA